MPSSVEQPRYLLIYGTQTGQAKAISEELAERSEKAGLVADIHCFSRIEKEFVLENEPLVVIVCSTTGDGEPPESVLKFWRRIKRRTVPKDHLSKVQYSLLGLGDSNYSQFCNCPKLLDKRLQEVGASHFLSPVWGDDAVGLEVEVEPWIDKLLITLCAHFGLPPPSEDNKAMNALNSDAPKSSNGSNPTLELSNGSNTEKMNGENSVTSLSDLIKQNLTLDNGDESKDLITGQDEKPSNDNQFEDSSEKSNRTTDWLTIIPVVDISELTLPSSPAAYIQIDPLSADADSSSATTQEKLPIQNNCKLPFAASPIHSVDIVSIDVLTSPEAVKKTLCVKLNTKDVTDYQSGDSFSIIAQNDEKEVNWLLKRVGVADIYAVIRLSVNPETTKKKAAVPEFINNPSSLLDIFTTSLDIRSVPKKAVLKLLAGCCSDDTEKQKLLYLSSRQGADTYRSLIVESKRSILHILHDFPSCQPKIESLLETLPRLLPRAYSVASESGSKELSFAFNVIQLPDIGHLTNRQGLVTGMFNTQSDKENSKYPQVHMYLRTQQHFRLPEDQTLPLILIGPGAGIAPFIGFLRDRKRRKEAGEVVGKCLLFFGNRHRERDYLYRDELQNHIESGSLTELHVCFSRDSPESNPGGAKYVTDLMRLDNNQTHLSELITNQSAHIYVCGDANNMAKDVSQAVANILKTRNGYTDDEVITAVKELRVEKRYREDVWT